MSIAVRDLPAGGEHERLVRVSDESAQLNALIAVHSTARGPAAGGCRLWRYANERQARDDALRLSEGMTLKNAAAELPLGGGKAVIMAPRGEFDRHALFESFGEAVERLGGEYVTAEDVGVGPTDMAAVAERTRHVAGLSGRSGDPSPVTAQGVFASLCIGLEYLDGKPGPVDAEYDPEIVRGRVVALQGLGHVGWRLAELLSRGGARLVVADLDDERARAAREAFGARIVPADSVHAQPADVFAPCALGGILNADSIPELEARLVCGAANNQLDTFADAARLALRGVLYLPDFVVNAGGIINVASELLGINDPDWVPGRLRALERTLREVLQEAHGKGTPPVCVAQDLARRRLLG